MATTQAFDDKLVRKVNYIVQNNPRGVMSLLHKFGFPSPQTPDQLIKETYQFVKELREDAIAELMTIHPDRNMIIFYNEKPVEIASNFSGSNDTQQPTQVSTPEKDLAQNGKIIEVNLPSPERNNFFVFLMLGLLLYLVVNHK